MPSISQEQYSRITLAAQDKSRIKGSTHQFYRYPARFSPQFVGAVIAEFSKLGDLVVDPFVGGGTTLVEAMRMGRSAFGGDLNELAVFVSEVKTTPLSVREIGELRSWFTEISGKLNLSKKVERDISRKEAGYFRNMICPETWRHQKLLQIALDEMDHLSNDRCANFARCVVLRTAQGALDGRKTVPPISEFRRKLLEHFESMLNGINSLSSDLDKIISAPDIIVSKQSASEIHKNRVLKKMGAPKLILTSPPYPGVHVLYHRWQIRGRKETPAPYWIANKLDGDGERYYTLGRRQEHNLKGYFTNLEQAFSSIAKVASEETLIVQMVAFSQPEWQLPKYLSALNNAGLFEVRSPLSADTFEQTENSRIWREVPNRKWHATLQSKRAGSREVVLFHKRA